MKSFNQKYIYIVLILNKCPILISKTLIFSEFNLDKKAASDTLHLLSDSLAAEQSIYIPSEYKMDARKRRRMAPIVAAVAAATVADTSHEVYDKDCPETANVTLVEHAADQARIANLKVFFLA